MSKSSALKARSLLSLAWISHLSAVVRNSSIAFIIFNPPDFHELDSSSADHKSGEILERRTRSSIGKVQSPTLTAMALKAAALTKEAANVI